MHHAAHRLPDAQPRRMCLLPHPWCRRSFPSGAALGFPAALHTHRSAGCLGATEIEMADSRGPHRHTRYRSRLVLPLTRPPAASASNPQYLACPSRGLGRAGYIWRRALLEKSPEGASNDCLHENHHATTPPRQGCRAGEWPRWSLPAPAHPVHPKAPGKRKANHLRWDELSNTQCKPPPSRPLL